MTNRMGTAGMASGLALVALASLPVTAQEDGGLRLTFGISARIESVSNPGLTVPAEPTSNRLTSRLSFGLTDSTQAGSVSLSAAGTLSLDNRDDSADLLIDPDLQMSLTRIGPSSSLELSAFLRETDLDTLRGLILAPDTGEITSDVLGDGTQRQTGGALTLSFGEGGPWGGTLSAGVIDTTYRGTTTEDDDRRTNLDGTLRFELNPATEVTTGLRWSRFDQDGEQSRDTLRSDLGLRRNLPAGIASASVFAEDTEDGTRTGLAFRRTWVRPDSSLTVSIGTTRGVTGDLSPTGALDWRKALFRGSFSASLRRDVTSGDDDEETLVTTASLGLNHVVSPLASVNFGLNASESEETATDTTTRNVALSAIYTQSLPYDWVMDAGVTHRFRDEVSTGEATSNTIFLELRRSFDLRP